MDSSFIQVAFRRFLCTGGRKDEAARLFFFFVSPRSGAGTKLKR